jgi:hypothetical protein
MATPSFSLDLLSSGTICNLGVRGKYRPKCHTALTKVSSPALPFGHQSRPAVDQRQEINLTVFPVTQVGPSCIFQGISDQDLEKCKDSKSDLQMKKPILQ